MMEKFKYMLLFFDFMITKQRRKQIAVLTGGGDAPGLNAVIRGITVKAISLGYDVLGFRKGWQGLLGEGEKHPLDLDEVEDIHMTGGTILGTSRTNPFKVENGPEQLIENLKKQKCFALIAIGGEDTLGVAQKLYEKGVNVVGVPKTIDNDLNGTDYCFGFDTAVNRAAEAIHNLHTTAESHHRVLLIEIMGRHAGWVTLHAGMAGGAHIIVIPEVPFDVNEICKIIKGRENNNKTYTIIAIAEGAKPKEGDLVFKDEKTDLFGHKILGGIAEGLAKEIEKRTGKETRHVVLGHLQRAGSPTAFDRVLGTRLGVKAVELVHEGKFGRMTSLKGTEIVDVELKEALGELKIVPKHRYDEARLFFGFEG